MTHSKPRRDLSGIYIFDILPQDNGRRRPTCIEDCTEETRLTWLEAQSRDCLVNVTEEMDKTMGGILEMLNEEELECFNDEFGNIVSNLRPNTASTFNPVTAGSVNDFCTVVRLVANYFGICAKGSEAEIKFKEECTSR